MIILTQLLKLLYFGLQFKPLTSLSVFRLSTYSVEIYQSKFKNDWNAFVGHSKNGTFLFHRDFMEYHQHRFEDYSLMVFKNEELVALLPANRVGDELHSHQGLTYGGLLLSKEVRSEIVLNIYESVLSFLYGRNINVLYLKEIPSIYCVIPSDEIRYLNFILNAQLYRRDTLSVIDNQHRLRFSDSRVEGVKRANKQALQVVNDDDFKTFWNHILTINLKHKHDAIPVHSLEEILYLKQKFPEHIKQFNVYHHGNIVAGATIFETEQVAHCQYISGNSDKNRLGSLDFLHDYLINAVYANKRYFDFGTSNENNGKHINKGLQFWKEGFGARTITQDFYCIKTQNVSLLKSVLI